MNHHIDADKAQSQASHQAFGGTGHAPARLGGAPSSSYSVADPPEEAAGGRRFLFYGGILAAAALAAVAFFLVKGNGANPAAGAQGAASNAPNALPVKTVFPKRKTLVRTVEQPGSVKAWSQAELYAKVSGYLRSIRREIPPQTVADAVGQIAGGLGSGPAHIPAAAARWLAADQAAPNGPQTNIGSVVKAGEVLLVIDAPELFQELEQKKAVWQQRRAEVGLAQTAIETAEKLITAAKAKQKQAEIDVTRYAAEHAFIVSQHRNLQELAKDKSVPAELVKEKEFHVHAAKANWDSAVQKVQTLQAESAVVSSKLPTARADLKVKEALVTVAYKDLHKAQLLAEFSWLHAPFDGVVTYRGVDEGDFIQNSSSGQTRHVMTVAAINKVKVILDVPDREAVWVRPGTKATVLLEGTARRRIEARVSRTAKSLDNQARTMQVEVDLDNRNHELVPGMYVYVTLTLQEIADAQAVPATAVYSRSRGENYVIQVKDGAARRQRVRIRYDDGKELEVVKLIGDREVPLDGSEELIVSNKGEIAEGQRVRPATPAPGKGPGPVGALATPAHRDLGPPASREGIDEKDLTGAAARPGAVRPALLDLPDGGRGLSARPAA